MKEIGREHLKSMFLSFFLNESLLLRINELNELTGNQLFSLSVEGPVIEN